MKKKKEEFPEDLIAAFVKRETIVFVGGDVLRQFSLTKEAAWPGKFVERMARAVKYPGSKRSFFKVSEYAKDKNSLPWLIAQITRWYGEEHPQVNSQALSALASTKPRLVVSTWFDNYFLEILRHSLDGNVYTVQRDIDLRYQEGDSETSLIYLFGATQVAETLITDSKAYQERLHSRNLLQQYIVGLLANSTLFFMGYSSTEWFEFEDFYDRLMDITPDRHSRINYVLFEEAVDEATEKRLLKRDLQVIRSDDVKGYTYRLAQKVLLEQSRSGRQSRLPDLPPRPYKYLDYYSSDDAEIFYGRKRDIEKIVGLVLAHRSLTLFGASGVGKTSLLEAGVGPALEKRGLRTIRTRVLPDPARALAVALGWDLRTVSPSGNWLPLLHADMERQNAEGIVLIFDQFEEFFAELSNDVQYAFWEDVAYCIKDSGKDIRLIFTLRQEALYLFKAAFPAIPKPYDPTYYLDSLTDVEKIEAITSPAVKYQRPWSQMLVDKLIEDFRRFPGETAHLSIVLTTLWDQRTDSETDLKIYEKLRGVEGILTNYLWGAVETMPQSEKVEQVLKCFVSPERRKSQIHIDDIIAESGKRNFELTPSDVRGICIQLLASRLIRAVAGEVEVYELSHDVLAATISEVISEDEMMNKVAKRSIREAVQNWEVSKHLPGRQEYTQLAETALRAPLVANDLLFLSVSAAANGRQVNQWLEQAQREGMQIAKFYEKCVESESLLATHEFLRRMRTDYSDIYSLYIEKIAENKWPSVLLDLNDLTEQLVANGHGQLDDLKFELPIRHITIPKGEFLIGYKNKLAGTTPGLTIPEQSIYIDEYVIDRFLVTNLDYKKFVDAVGHRAPKHWVDGVIPYGEEYHPVTNVSWDDAAAYAIWCGKRLPTEAEWEKSAYWDPSSQCKYAYPWGDDFQEGVANYYNSFIGSTSPVGQFSPDGDSPYGLSDMAGNVFEWLLDDSIVPFRQFSSHENPAQIGSGPHVLDKMTRGGSYGGPKDQLHCAYREYARSPMIRDNYVGFRCVSSDRPEHYDLMTRLLKHLNAGQ